LSGFTTSTSVITFPTADVGVPDAPSAERLVVRNTGNTQVNVSMTAYNLVGNQNPQVLNATTFKVGTTLGGATVMQNNVTTFLSTVNPAPAANASYGFWLSMPANQYPQQYHSATNWAVVVS
jgi:hypothetical protein